ncbi:hypothetical protein G8759_25250 [Spirosoma aureum]|uniref:Uncharacterized protein n=1 Tax=Spirosoma aureum TaxID=2692134 RepID=A0A6G9ATM9_9BACT|nr:hypothetical protein [Spirosoma aureum]QIP15704.1 hypothetical protein G8759_25250 [Spirosoma aureum]
MTTSELAAMAGQWKLDAFYNDGSGYFSIYFWNVAHPSCPISNSWIYVEQWPDLRHGTLTFNNLTQCAATSTSSINAAAAINSIEFETMTNMSGEQVQWYCNDDSLPFSFGRGMVDKNYRVYFQNGGNTMVWEHDYYDSQDNYVTKAIVWVRASGGPSIP